MVRGPRVTSFTPFSLTCDTAELQPCVGLAAAHAKAAELRMGRYKDVILSLAKSSEGDEPTT
jgi:hypothetical protein